MWRFVPTTFDDCMYFFKETHQKIIFTTTSSLQPFVRSMGLALSRRLSGAWSQNQQNQPKPIKISFILRLGNVLRSIIECKLIFT